MMGEDYENINTPLPDFSFVTTEDMNGSFGKFLEGSKRILTGVLWAFHVCMASTFQSSLFSHFLLLAVKHTRLRRYLCGLKGTTTTQHCCYFLEVSCCWLSVVVVVVVVVYFGVRGFRVLCTKHRVHRTTVD
jgi:hypothetical protein